MELEELAVSGDVVCVHLLVAAVGYERNRNPKALTKNLPRRRLLVSVLGSRKFQIPGRHSVIGFMIFDIIG